MLIRRLLAPLVDGGNDLVELEVNGLGVLVLGPLDQKHHEEGIVDISRLVWRRSPDPWPGSPWSLASITVT